MNLVVYGVASPAPPVLVTLFECKMTVYVVPLANVVLDVILSVLPFMFVVYGFICPY